MIEIIDTVLFKTNLNHLHYYVDGSVKDWSNLTTVSYHFFFVSYIFLDYTCYINIIIVSSFHLHVRSLSDCWKISEKLRFSYIIYTQIFLLDNIV